MILADWLEENENELVDAIADEVVSEIKIGTARSGNRGHSGRPGKVGGSGPGGGGEPVGLFARTDEQLANIEAGQKTIIDGVFQRQLEVEDFMPGGKYEKITELRYGIGKPAEEISETEELDAIDSMIAGSNKQVLEGNTFDVLDKVNKFDSQNALYDRLKDNNDFEELTKGSFRPFNEGKNIYSWARGLDENQYNEEIKKKNIRNLVDHWASTSGDTDPKAIAMQIAANELFGGDSKIEHMIGGILRAWDKEDLELELKFNPGRKAFLQAQYDATQDYLRKAGVKEVIVYRGHEGKRSALEGGNDVEVNMQPLSSFSMNPYTAAGFAVSASSGQIGTTNKPSIIASVVPAKRIFALPNTGIGCTGEMEAVVLGGKMRATVISGIPAIHQVIGQDFDAIRQVKFSANDIKRNLVPKVYPNTPALSALLAGKAVKPDVPNLDEDIENADWTKRTWDLPEYGSKEFNEFLDLSGMTLAKFRELPVWKWRSDKPPNKSFNQPNLSQDRFLSETLGLGRVFSLGSNLDGIYKGGPGSGNFGHAGRAGKVGGSGTGKSPFKNWKDVSGQMAKNLAGIADGTAKRIPVSGDIVTTNIKDIVGNMRAEADLYTSYLASDTAVKLRDFASSYENILYEGARNGEFNGVKAKNLDDFGVDCVRKMVHQEIESNRQSYSDHGIRHIEGNVQRQLELMDKMGNPTAIDKLSALAIMTNHDMGYTIESVRGGANPGGGVHQKASGEMYEAQRSIWNEGKIFSTKQFDRVSEAIKTHDSTEMDKDNLLTSTRISDNLALFAKEKLPSMFRYVKGGETDLVRMGDAAKKNDAVAFESARASLYKKIDDAALNINLKRDLKAGTATINSMTPKFSLGVLAGEISSISGDKAGKVSVSIQYSAWDSFLQNHFEMGQKQTKKLLGDYGVTDFSKTDYNIGGVLDLRVVGAPRKEIGGLGMIFKQYPHLSHPFGSSHGTGSGVKAEEESKTLLQSEMKECLNSDLITKGEER